MISPDNSNCGSIQICFSRNVITFRSGQNSADAFGKVLDFTTDSTFLVVKGGVDDAPADGHVPDQVVDVERVLDER
jgi:hypothetical protein